MLNVRCIVFNYRPYVRLQEANLLQIHLEGCILCGIYRYVHSLLKYYNYPSKTSNVVFRNWLDAWFSPPLPLLNSSHTPADTDKAKVDGGIPLMLCRFLFSCLLAFPITQPILTLNYYRSVYYPCDSPEDALMVAWMIGENQSFLSSCYLFVEVQTILHTHTQ